MKHPPAVYFKDVFYRVIIQCTIATDIINKLSKTNVSKLLSADDSLVQVKTMSILRNDVTISIWQCSPCPVSVDNKFTAVARISREVIKREMNVKLTTFLVS